MNALTKRRALPLGLLGLLALCLFASSCNLQWSSYAARVGGTEVSQAQLSSALKRASHDSSFSCLLEGSATGGYRLEGTGTGTYDSAFAAFILTDMIDSQIASDVVRAKHLITSKAAYQLAYQQVDQALGNQASQAGCSTTSRSPLAGLGSSLAASFARLQLDEDALAAARAGVSLTQAGIRRYEASHQSLTRERCISGIFVKQKATADSIERALGSGASFSSEVAKYAKSATSSAGPLGCYTLAQLAGISPQLAGAVSSGPIGKGLPAVYYQSSNGAAWLVTEVTSEPFQPTAAVLNELFSAESTAFEKAIRSSEPSLQVSIDPRYGTWVPASTKKSAATAGFGGRVVPPKCPPIRFVLNGSTVRGKAKKAGPLAGAGG